MSDEQTPELEVQTRLIAALRAPACYAHAVEAVEVIETHISWVLLAGACAYKIKKAIALDFLDYRALADRRRYCEEELRLNRRAAEALYLEVVAIGGPPDAPRVGGTGPVVEYAVRMARFDQDALLGRLLSRGRPGTELGDRLGERVAAFHAALPATERMRAFGAPAAVCGATAQIAAELDALLPHAAQAEWRAVRRWITTEGERLEAAFAARQRAGAIRECHGDLHCANVIVTDRQVQLFDAIEFSESLRIIDVMSDIAFLVMDLQAAGREDLAWQCLNRYLEISGDYAGLAVLRYYLAYRALVRCMVESLRAREKPARAERARRYLALAHRHATTRRPALLLTHGLSGSGKSTLAMALCRLTGAIRLRSDVERTRIWRPGAGDKYGAAATEATYARLAQMGEALLDAGWSAVIDAACLRRAQRDRFRALAASRTVPFAIIDVDAPTPLLRARVAARYAAGSDASEADLAVLEQQLAHHEPLTADERAVAIRCDSTRDLALADAREHWSALFGRLGWGEDQSSAESSNSVW